MEYLGNNPSLYENKTWNFYGFPIQVFEQVTGNGNWTDFIEIAKYGNLTNKLQLEGEGEKETYLSTFVMF